MEAIHHWKARFGVGATMLILAFLGMVVTDVRTTGGWDYWKWMVLVYAVMALWLSWDVRRQMDAINPITIWHEALHWVGLISAIFLVSYLVGLGVISRFIAGIFHLILLSLGVFLAGIYIEWIFLLVGIILGFFAILAAVLVEYLYAFLIPVVLGGIAIMGISLWISHKAH